MRYGSGKQNWVFAGLIVLALFLILVNKTGFLKPAESVAAQSPRPLVYVLNGIGGSFKSFFTYFSSVGKINRENAVLEEKVRTLEQEKIILQQQRLENEKLKKELDYRDESPLQFISARVIGKDPTNFSQTLILNAGENKGVKNGAAVLSQGVFIGKIVSVSSFTSQIMLVTDPQSNIDAQISSTGDNGIVRGSYGSGMVLDMISQNARINKGDEVATLGLTAQVPKGILMGTVGEFQSQKNDILQKATVIPSVDLKNLDFVSVVKQ
jgi:rod shape-determining protein MreC